MEIKIPAASITEVFKRRIGLLLLLMILTKRTVPARAFWRGTPQAAATAPAPPLQMKTVANLDVDFARVQIVSSAEGKTVVEQNAAIGNVDGLQIGGEFLAKLLAE